jgi:Lytic polysaccharide mono-oxygenase, cellulose-degrading
LNNLVLSTGAKTSSMCGSYQENTNLDFDRIFSGSRATYSAGQVIPVSVYLQVHHEGHFEMSYCQVAPNTTPSQSCFGNNPKLRVTSHGYGGPLDPNYPHRYYLPPKSVATDLSTHNFQVQLPSNLPSGNYILKWTYFTANGCYSPGYPDYDTRAQSAWSGGIA